MTDMAACSRWEGRVEAEAEENTRQRKSGMKDEDDWEDLEDSGEGSSNRPPMRRRSWNGLQHGRRVVVDGDLILKASQSQPLTDEEFARLLQQQEDEAAELQRIQQQKDEEIARREQEQYNNEAGWNAVPKLKRKSAHLLDELQSACKPATQDGDVQEDGPLKDDECYAKIVQERCNLEARLQEEKRLRKLHEVTGWLGDLSDRKLRDRPQKVDHTKEERKFSQCSAKATNSNRTEPAKKEPKRARKDEEISTDGLPTKSAINGKVKKNGKRKVLRDCDSPKSENGTHESSPGGADENFLGRVVLFKGRFGRIIQRLNPGKLSQEIEKGLEIDCKSYGVTEGFAYTICFEDSTQMTIPGKQLCNAIMFPYCFGTGSILKPWNAEKYEEIDGYLLPITGLLSGLAPGVLGSIPDYKRRYAAWQWEEKVYCDRSPGALQFEYYKFGTLSLQCADSAKERHALAARIAAARVEFLSHDSPYKEQLANGAQYKVEVFDTKTERGWGVRALEDIPEGRAVVEYAGENHRKERCRRVCDDGAFNLKKEGHMPHSVLRSESHERAEKSDGSCESSEDSDFPPSTSPKDYYFQLRGHRWDVDALKIGNVGRFVNHACDGFNLKAVDFLASANDTKSEMPKRIALVSTRTIFAYEELSYNYRGDGCKPNVRNQKCFCGSPSCQGFIW